MTNMSLQIPDAALSALKRSPEEFGTEIRLAAAVHWYSRGDLSQEVAADLAGLDRTDFLMTLGRLKIFTFDVEDLGGESVMVPEAAFIDASPLIYLSRWVALDVLRVSPDVRMPASVADGLRRRGTSDPAVQAIAGTPWLKVVPDPTPPASVEALGLGKGETSVLAGAMAHPGAAVIVDDLATRRCAAKHRIRCIGTLGLVLNAKRRGVIRAARPVVNALSFAGMYIPNTEMNAALSLVGE